MIPSHQFRQSFSRGDLIPARSLTTSASLPFGTPRLPAHGARSRVTAVAEHDGRLVRFQPRFLAFAREYGFYPHACNLGAGWEKGKVEKGGIAYLRSNFWPLRTFTDITDVNRQVR